MLPLCRQRTRRSKTALSPLLFEGLAGVQRLRPATGLCALNPVDAEGLLAVGALPEALMYLACCRSLRRPSWLLPAPVRCAFKFVLRLQL
jgi:hypothetical protein